MKPSLDWMAGGVFSVALHSFLFWPGTGMQHADAGFDQGITAVRLTLAPSAAAAIVVPESEFSASEQAPPVEPSEPAVPDAVLPPEKLPDVPVKPDGLLGAADPDPGPVLAAEPPSQTDPVASPEREGSLEEEGVVTPAEISGTCRPHYPRLSRRLGHEGTVILQVTIEKQGRTGRIQVLQSSGHPPLDQSAVEALQQAVFSPARRHGRPVASTREFDFEFKLEDAAP